MARGLRWISAVVALVAIVAGAALSSSASSATPGPETPRLVSLRPCANQVRVRCGLVAVPADWASRTGPMLRVRFEVYDHSDVHASALKPIVGMEGGPGFSSIQSAPSYLAMIGSLHRRHDLIVMDDRGTGGSSAINCPALQRYAALARPGHFVAAVDACRHQLGPEASAYSTVAVGAFPMQPGAHPVRVDLTAPAFAQLVYDASYSASVFTDLPAVMRAYAAGEPRPLLRMAAEDREFNASGPANYFSIGDLEAVSCHDYPTAWSRTATPSTRRAELARRIAKLGRAFSPFPTRVYLRSYVENELVYGCRNWPAPRPAEPPFPSRTRYSHTPTLIFDGEFDFATPLADARKAARVWPNHTFVEVRNAKHVTAAGDQEDCTDRILRRFLAALSAGDTSCARQMPAIAVLPRFPRRLADAPAARARRSGEPTSIRRIAWVGAETVADALTAWFGEGAGTGAPADALFGGSFTVHGDRLSGRPIRVRLDQAQLVPGVLVSGTAIWQKRRARLVAVLALRTRQRALGRLTLAWRTGVSDWRLPARITGTISGKPVNAEMPAPWAPQS